MELKFKDLERLTSSELDMVIIGSGAAGIEIAQYFADKKQTVLIIERGPEKFSWTCQKDFQFQSVGKPIRQADFSTFFDLAAAKKSLCRCCGFGGTLNLWGENWKLLTDFDLSGQGKGSSNQWPFDFYELWKFYEKAASLHDLNKFVDFTKTVSGPANPFQIPAPLIGSPRCKVIRRFESDSLPESLDRILRSINLKIIMEACAVSFELNPQRTCIESILVRDKQANSYRVRAKVFVLACGAVENARLILANPQLSVPGSGFDRVGKYLMDHPKGHCGYLYPYRNDVNLESVRIKKGNQEFIVDYVFSPVHLNTKNLSNHCILISPDRHNKLPRYKISFQLAQEPYEASCVSLSAQTDSFGLAIPVVDWRISENDERSFQRFLCEVASVFKELKIGDVSYLDNSMSVSSMRDASHQMGTTRISSSPDSGVVNRDLQYFGLENLYIVGSSVFRTSGNAHPTFTIKSLAIRLAEHLNREY